MEDRRAPTSLDGATAQTDGGLVSARPPGGFVVLRTWTLLTAHELSQLRAQLVQEITDDVGAIVPDLATVPHTMVLVASELATNALRHGIPPTIVRLLREDDTYLIDVADHDVTSVPKLAGERPPGHGGFGLQIARRLAIEVGWYATETTKHVWAEFPVPQPV